MPATGRSPLSRALGVAWIAGGLLAPSAARAQAGEAIAEALFVQAQERMAAHDVDQACDLFARSLKVDRALGTLLNLAVCHEKQGKTASAWAEFEEAEATARRAGDTPRADLARTHLTALDPVVPRIFVEITTPAPGLRAVLDGAELPREAWGTAVPLDPGEHRLEVSAEDRLPFVRTLHLGPHGGTDRIEVTLESPPAVAPVPAPAPDTLGAPPEPPEPPRKTTRIDPLWVGGWVSTGAGIVSLGVAGVMGVGMASSVSRRNQLCPPGTLCTNQDAYFADHTARVDQVAMFVSGGIGLAALGAGASLLAVSHRKASATSRFALTPVVGPTGAGLGLRGAF